MIMNRRNVLCALPSRYGLGSTFPDGRTAHSHGAHGGLTVVTPLNAGPSTRIVGVQETMMDASGRTKRMTYDWVIVPCLPNETIEIVPPLREARRVTPLPKECPQGIGTIVYLADMTSDLWQRSICERRADGGWRIRLMEP